MTENQRPEADENTLRRDIERISRLLNDPSQDAAISSQELEARLRENLQRLDVLEQARRAQEAGRGVIAKLQAKPSVEMSAESTGLDITVKLGMSHVPTGIVHLLVPSETPLVRFELKFVRGRARFARLRVTSRVEGYSAHAVDTVELERGGPEPNFLAQLPAFYPSRLKAIRELTRASLLVQVAHLDGSGVELAQSYPIWLMPPTTALLSAPDPVDAGKKLDFTPYLAAWVTPNDPPVHTLVSEAARINPNHHLAGYLGDDLDVEEEVRSVYNALKARRLCYVNSVIAYGAGDAEVAQRVRLPRESLASCSANCLDGTVLMASALENISLNAAIVLVPLHAFLGWRTWSGRWDYVETTMIATHDFEAAQAKARGTAARYESDNEPARFRRHELAFLRTKMGISPMPLPG